MSRPLSKSLLLWTRTLHIYITMFALILLIFFAFTGFIMNHPGWFDIDTPRIVDSTLDIPIDIATSKFQDRKLQMVEYLRAHANARGEMTAYGEEEASARVQFTSAGRKMEFSINRDDGTAALHDEVHNTLALLADLHKGTGSGASWRLMIDATSLFLLFASLSGVILWIALPKRRALGIISLGAGVALCTAIYLLLVP